MMMMMMMNVSPQNRPLSKLNARNAAGNKTGLKIRSCRTRCFPLDGGVVRLRCVAVLFVPLEIGLKTSPNPLKPRFAHAPLANLHLDVAATATVVAE